jgi:UPF0755 protein
MKKSGIQKTDILFISISLVFLSIVIAYLIFFKPISMSDQWKEVKVPKGATYAQGISILLEEGIIKNKFIFLVLGRLTYLEKQLRAGYYNLNTSMSPLEIFNRLRKGMIVQYTVVIPEGNTLADIKEKFINTRLMDEESWQLVRDREFLSSLDIDAPSLEGYLFPDTYNFAKGADPGDILKIMVQRLRTNFNQSLKRRAEELGMTEKEVLTLASIIEHEAIFDRERPLISAVYHNRLRKNMRLQADPTVVYGIKRMQEGITRRDLKRVTPYNTYVINGLPPGPISSPGSKSIRAALYPADVDYLYFVSKNNGTHYFSRTGDEHLEAVILYQRRKKEVKNVPELAPAGHTQEENITRENEIETKEEKSN